MARLSRPSPDDLDDAQRAVLDEIVTGRRSAQSPSAHLVDAQGRPRGPFAAMVAAPSTGGPLAGLGEALRFDSSLPDAVRELTILMIAAHHGSTFEWVSHVDLAAAAGVPTSAIAAVQRRERTPLDDPQLEAARRFVSALLDDRAVDDATFAATRQVFGEAGVVELITLTGYYELLALLLAVLHDPDAQAESTPAEEVNPPGGSPPAG